MKKRTTSITTRYRREMKTFFATPVAMPSREATACLATGSRLAVTSMPRGRRSRSARAIQGVTDGCKASPSRAGTPRPPPAASRSL